MVDSLGRKINYLRISVTDRCNLRCRYCMPEQGVKSLGHEAILSLEDIARLVRIGARLGIRKVRITGGEPLVRKNLTNLIRYIREIPEIDDIAITTNGILFAPMAEELRTAGLNRANISMDSLDSDKFSFITRGGKLEKVQASIKRALELDMHPVKINTVVIKGFNDNEVLDFAQLAVDYPLHIRFIEFMPIGDLLFWKPERMISAEEIKTTMEQHYKLVPPGEIIGNGPAKYYNIEGGQGSVGFISPMSHHFCHECNRIRLTADGKLRGCLYGEHEMDLSSTLHRGGSDKELEKLFIETIRSKPARHHMNDGWGERNERKMYQIGG